MNHSDFDKLYREHRNMVRGIVFEYEKDPSKTSDLLHEIYLRAWEYRDSFRGESKASTWLYRIAHRVCKNYIRDEVDRSVELVPESNLQMEDYPSEEDSSWLEENCIDVDDPMEVYAAEQEATMALSDLTYMEQQVWSMVWGDLCTAQEVAKELNISPATVGVHIHNIREKFLKRV